MSDSGQRFGLSAALATPFEETGGIDLARLAGHAVHCLEAGCDSVTLFGTTGEGASIGPAERTAVFEALSGSGVDAHRLVAGIAATSVADAVRDISAAQAHGCAAILLPPPFYFKHVTDDGVFAWYAAVLKQLGERARNILLYHIPSLTGVALSIDLVTRLRNAFPHAVLGVKDSGCDWSFTEPLLAAHGDLAILVGDERHIARAVRQGAQGSICGVANLRPAELRVMAWQGRESPEIETLVELVTDYPVVPALKALMACATGEPGWQRVRPPLDPLSAEAIAALRRGMDSHAGGLQQRR